MLTNFATPSRLQEVNILNLHFFYWKQPNFKLNIKVAQNRRKIAFNMLSLIGSDTWYIHLKVSTHARRWYTCTIQSSKSIWYFHILQDYFLCFTFIWPHKVKPTMWSYHRHLSKFNIWHIRESLCVGLKKTNPLIWPFINFASQLRSWNLKRQYSWWQDVTRWYIFGCNPMTKIVCVVGSAHNRAVHCMCAQLESRNLIMWTLPPVHGAMNEG
jgi:hypothetical protein